MNRKNEDKNSFATWEFYKKNYTNVLFLDIRIGLKAGHKRHFTVNI